MSAQQLGERLWRLRAPMGVAATVLAFVGLTAHSAFTTPPFFGVDEVAHVGYAHAVADGELPEIDDVPEIPASATQWQAKQRTNLGTHRATVWVASHPPAHYVLAVPLVWFAEASDRRDGGLLLLRVLNLTMAAIGVGFTYLLALETAGGSRRIGLLAAALVAFMPIGHEQFGWALNDGTAFAATTALAWAAVRWMRDNSRRSLVLIASFAAFAASVRTSAMITAVAVIATAAVCAARRDVGWRRRRAVTRVAVVGGVPALVMAGWFYVRNVVLYGDIAGAERIRELQNLQGRGMWDVLTSGQMWRDVFEGLAQTSFSFLFGRRDAALRVVVDVAAVAAVAGLAMIAGRRTGFFRPDDRPSSSRPALAINAVVLLSTCGAILTFAAAGGPTFSRYLLPGLGALATLVVIGLDRVLPTVAPAALITFLAIKAWSYVDDAETYVSAMPRGFNESAAGPILRESSLALAHAATAFVLGGLLLETLDRLLTWRRTTQLRS